MDNLTEFIKLAKKALKETETARPLTIYNRFICDIEMAIAQHKSNTDIDWEINVPNLQHFANMLSLQGSLYQLLGRIKFRRMYRECNGNWDRIIKA